MDDPSPKEHFLQSLDRCCHDENFIPSFYERFLASSDEVKSKFQNTDFEEQNQKLIRSLRLAADATSGLPEALREVRERAETHDRHHLNIKPHFYDVWLESVIETASDYDMEWSEQIEAAWRKTLGHVIEHMIKFY